MRTGLDLPLGLRPGAAVLVVGCGGGFDIVAGLPVALRLHAMGHHVHLANYCVGNVAGARGAVEVAPRLWRVPPEAIAPEDVRGFPEGPLARWWSRTFAPAPVWCLARPGVRTAIAALQHLQRELELEAIVATDGGVDGLFLGHEHDTGTPSMDAITLIASSRVPGLARHYVVSAFGTEGPAHSIRHAEVLERMAELVRADALVGVAALTRSTQVGSWFADAVESIHAAFPRAWESIIVHSIAAALRGAFGHVNLTARTDWAPVWVSPLQLLYWAFELDPVVRAKPYLGEVLDTDTVEEVADAIERARQRLGVRPRTDIPI